VPALVLDNFVNRHRLSGYFAGAGEYCPSGDVFHSAELIVGLVDFDSGFISTCSFLLGLFTSPFLLFITFCVWIGAGEETSMARRFVLRSSGQRSSPSARPQFTFHNTGSPPRCRKRSGPRPSARRMEVVQSFAFGATQFYC
jgi:hypothetical protein